MANHRKSGLDNPSNQPRLPCRRGPQLRRNTRHMMNCWWARSVFTSSSASARQFSQSQRKPRPVCDGLTVRLYARCAQRCQRHPLHYSPQAPALLQGLSCWRNPETATTAAAMEHEQLANFEPTSALAGPPLGIRLRCNPSQSLPAAQVARGVTT